MPEKVKASSPEHRKPHLPNRRPVALSKMQVISRPQDAYQASIVAAAMVRSFSAAQVAQCQYADIGSDPGSAVLINPPDSSLPLLRKLLASQAKVLILGKLSLGLAETLLLQLDPSADVRDCQGSPKVDSEKPFNLSPAAVYYTDDHPLGRASPINPRHLCRYDFTDEWNNLGYGQITTDGGPFSLSCLADCAGAICIARLAEPANGLATAYMTLLDTPQGSALWCNRQVGPVDSLEWCIVERFFADHRQGDLPTFPYLSEIPAGYDAAFTMRLDCDQAISSVQPLLDLYADRSLPVSLALQTGLPTDHKDMDLLSQVVASGGAVLPHSVNHLPNWGGSYHTALQEARSCKQYLADNLPQAPTVKFAVSPAHQNPIYALQALADAGYNGFVGGIIHNDPEFLLGRAGQVPFLEKDFVSHSQQCMLHGDCYHRYGNSVEVYKSSFDNHVQGQAIFAYLDHPFSQAYQYGWLTEAERLDAHRTLIDHMQSSANLWQPNLNQSLDFIVKRNSVRICLDLAGRLEFETPPADELPAVGIIHNGQTIACG